MAQEQVCKASKSGYPKETVVKQPVNQVTDIRRLLKPYMIVCIMMTAEKPWTRENQTITTNTRSAYGISTRKLRWRNLSRRHGRIQLEELTTHGGVSQVVLNYILTNYLCCASEGMKSYSHCRHFNACIRRWRWEYG